MSKKKIHKWDPNKYPKGCQTSSTEKTSPYKFHLDWASAHYFYIKHYNSGPWQTEYREPNYTFFADMAICANFYGGEQLKAKLKAYKNRVMHLCKNNKDALCIMIDSLNLLSWVLFEANGNQPDPAIDYLIAEYENLMYNEECYRKYVSDNDMKDIWRELN